MSCPCCSYMPLALKSLGEGDGGECVQAVAPMLTGLQGDAKCWGFLKLSLLPNQLHHNQLAAEMCL